MKRRDLLLTLPALALVAACKGPPRPRSVKEDVVKPEENVTAQPKLGTFTIYGEHWCPHCRNLMAFFEEKHIKYTFYLASANEERFEFNGWKTIPQVYAPSGIHLGGVEATMDFIENKWDTTYPR